MSLRAHIFNWVVRRQMAKNAGAGFDVATMRRTFDNAPFSLPKGISCQKETIAGVAGEWVRGPAQTPNRRMLYIHGGGFIACSARSHRAITGAFAARGFDVFAANYRLAPEHPFPAALEDLLAVWTALVRTGPLVVAGDSAGGNLALSLTLKARAAGLSLPRAMALFSPATDLMGTGASLTTNAHRDPMLNGAALRHLAPLYLGNTAADDPLVSPLYADLAGFPPLLVHVGEREILRDDSTRLAERARAAGVIVDLKIYPVVPHVWQIAQKLLPEARRSLDEAAAFLRHHVEGG